MINTEIEYPDDREQIYSIAKRQLKALMENEKMVIPNLANASALLYEVLSNINWAGFYLKNGNELILGPFQGRPACIRIPWGKGVCGTAAASDSIQCVENVNLFSGHIACDSRSKSEIVVPIHHDGQVIGVLDIDSAVLANFSEVDIKGLSEIVNILESGCEWSNLKLF